MRMNKLLTMLLTLALLLAVCVSASAEAYDFYYDVGDVMEDFSVTLADGTETSLSAMLSEKQMVLINFWASWCGPCGSEFPYMQSAYDKYADKVGIVALSIESTDTDDVIMDYKKANNLPTLPMGRDNGLSDSFVFNGIPTSIVVDRNGVICMIEIGSTDAFEQLFALFTADDYTGPVLLQNGVPGEKYDGALPDSAALSAALNAEGGSLIFSCAQNDYAWPFIPSGTEAKSSNAGVNKTYAVVETTVNVQSGDALSLDYCVSSEEYYDFLKIYLNGQRVKLLSGDTGWTTLIIPFKTEGEQKISIAYEKDEIESDGDDCAIIRNVKHLTGDEAAAAIAALPEYPHALEGNQVALEILSESAKQVVIHEPSGTWDMYYSNLPVYVIPGTDGAIVCKALIGQDVDPELAIVQDGVGDYHFLANADVQEDGFLVIGGLVSVAEEGTGINFITLSADAYDSGSNYDEVLIFASEEDLNFFTQIYLLQCGFPVKGTWTYADGTLSSTDACSEPAPQIAIPDDCALYTVVVTDEGGNGVEGVLVQICDESTCEVIPTDEDGFVQFIKPCYAYEVHVLMAPDIFAAPTETYVLPKEGTLGTALFITLERSKI